MTTEEILHLWSEACGAAGVPWTLYKAALLCAEGYRAFPETLASAQVAVFAKDLPAVLEQVIPALPRDWILSKDAFVEKSDTLHLLHADSLLLEIDLLRPASDPDQTPSFLPQLQSIRTKTRSKLRLLKLLPGSFPGVRNQIIEKAFRALADHAAASEANAPCYCDHATNKLGHTYPQEWFSGTASIQCAGHTYPVFPGYLEYLHLHYGDYEAGLFDEIGCGLTAQDKLALKEHQQHCKEALHFLNELSREFGLEYYLLAGSVLGPVRDGGVIPWDDDIDVGIRLENLAEFESLVKAHLPQRLPEGFALRQSGVNNPYPRMFSKICYEGRCCIDLWPLIPTYLPDDFRGKLQWRIGKVITKVHYKKIGYKVTRFKKLVQLADIFLSDRLVMWIARSNEKRYLHKNTPAYINLYSIYPRQKEIILRKWLDTPATAAFDGMEVPIVGCTEEYLTHLYGNYMVLPAPWKRASRHVERF